MSIIFEPELYEALARFAGYLAVIEGKPVSLSQALAKGLTSSPRFLESKKAMERLKR